MMKRERRDPNRAGILNCGVWVPSGNRHLARRAAGKASCGQCLRTRAAQQTVPRVPQLVGVAWARSVSRHVLLHRNAACRELRRAQYFVLLDEISVSWVKGCDKGTKLSAGLVSKVSQDLYPTRRDQVPATRGVELTTRCSGIAVDTSIERSRSGGQQV